MSEEIKTGYLRVTEVMKPFIDFSKIPPKVLKHACDRGTKVHRLAELYAKDEYFPEPEPELSGYVDSFKMWFDEMVEEVVSLEVRLYDNTLMITGAIDLVAKLKGSDGPVIVDYKTPANASKSWALQLSAYQNLYNIQKDNKEKVNRRIALQLMKDGKYPKIHEYTNPKDFEIYKGILQAVRFFQ